jgi:drug/metabolite transporter (DMT)-like permease
MPNFAPSLIAVLCWGAMFPIASTALDDVDAVHLTAVRYVAASLIFVALLAATEGRRSLRFDGRLAHVFLLGTAGFAGFNLLAFAALGHTSPEHAALVVATTPGLTLLYRWAKAGERPLPIQLACVVAAFAGVGLVITKGDPASLLDGSVGIGELMVLGGVICWVRYTAGPAELPGWSPLRFTALTALAGTVTVLAITLVADIAGWLDVPTVGDVGAIVPQLGYVIVFGAVVAVIAWNSGVQRVGPANAALFMNLVPVTAFVIEAARGTSPAAVEIAGAGLTVTALAVANLAGRRAASTAALAAHDAPEERHHRPEEVVGLRSGGQRVEVARAAGAVDERRG